MSDSSELIKRAKQSAKIGLVASTATDLSKIPPQDLNDAERTKILKEAVQSDLATQKHLKENPVVQINARKANLPLGTLSPDIPDENIKVDW